MYESGYIMDKFLILCGRLYKTTRIGKKRRNMAKRIWRKNELCSSIIKSQHSLLKKTYLLNKPIYTFELDEDKRGLAYVRVFRLGELTFTAYPTSIDSNGNCVLSLCWFGTITFTSKWVIPHSIIDSSLLSLLEEAVLCNVGIIMGTNLTAGNE